MFGTSSPTLLDSRAFSLLLRGLQQGRTRARFAIEEETKDFKNPRKWAQKTYTRAFTNQTWLADDLCQLFERDFGYHQ